MSTFTAAIAVTATQKAAEVEAAFLAGPAYDLTTVSIGEFLALHFGDKADALQTEFSSHVVGRNSDGDVYDRSYHRVSSTTGSVLVLVDVYRPRKLYGEQKGHELRKIAFRSSSWRLPLSPNLAARSLDG